MIEYISLARRLAPKEAAMLFYAPVADPCLEELVGNVDCSIHFDEESRSEARVVAKIDP